LQESFKVSVASKGSVIDMAQASGAYIKLPNDLKDHYEATELIYNGTEGSVYCGRRYQPRIVVALKCIRRAQYEDKRTLYERIISAGGFGVREVKLYDDCAVVVSDYIEGVTLGNSRYHSTYSANETMYIIVEIVEVLMRLHSLGIAHGDIRSHNVMRDGHKKVHLIDFGSVIGLDDLPGYPPIPRNPWKGSIAQKDIYDLGALWYELLAGRRLTIEYIVGQVGFFLAEEVCAIISKCLSTDNRMRYQSIRELSEDIGVLWKKEKSPQKYFRCKYWGRVLRWWTFRRK
jgi:serine/threonine protein kinase